MLISNVFVPFLLLIVLVQCQLWVVHSVLVPSAFGIKEPVFVLQIVTIYHFSAHDLAQLKLNASREVLMIVEGDWDHVVQMNYFASDLKVSSEITPLTVKNAISIDLEFGNKLMSIMNFALC